MNKKELDSHKAKQNALEDCKNSILKAADVFRCNDLYLKGLGIEERTFLNDMGHILDWLWASLMAYRYASDEKKRELRQEMHAIRHKIEDRKSRPEHIGSISEDVRG